MSGLQYTVLTAVISTDTLKLIFTEELEFIKQHRNIFLEKHPDVIFAINSSTFTVAQLQAVQGMINEVARLEAHDAEVKRKYGD
jgi:hypothetical protein